MFLIKPGTGKTSTIIGIISLFYQKVCNTDDKILICAPSNCACIEVMKRVMDDGIFSGGNIRIKPQVLRIGRLEKIKDLKV